MEFPTLKSASKTPLQNGAEATYQFGSVAQRHLAFLLDIDASYLSESDCATFFHPESSLNEKVAAFNQLQKSSPESSQSKFYHDEVVINDQPCIQFLIDNKVAQQVFSEELLNPKECLLDNIKSSKLDEHIALIDSPLNTDGVNANPEKVIAQLIQEGNHALSNLFLSKVEVEDGSVTALPRT